MNQFVTHRNDEVDIRGSKVENHTPLKTNLNVETPSSAICTVSEDRDESSSAKRGFFNIRLGTPREKQLNQSATQSLHSESSVSDELKKKLFHLNQSHAEIEVEHLNTISKLTLEKEKADDKVKLISEEASKLSSCNKDLLSKLSVLEEQFEKLMKDQKESHTIPHGGNETHTNEDSLKLRNSTLDSSSVISRNSTDSTLTKMRLDFVRQRNSVSESISSPRLNATKAKLLESRYLNALKHNDNLQRRITEAERLRVEMEETIESLRKKSENDRMLHNEEIQRLTLELENNRSINGKSNSIVDLDKLEVVKSKLSKLESLLKQRDDEIMRAKMELNSKKTLETEVAVLRRGIEDAKHELALKIQEADNYKEHFDLLRLDFITTQEKNASVFQELEEMRELYEAESAKTASLTKVLDVIEQTGQGSVSKNDESILSELEELKNRFKDKEAQLTRLQKQQLHTEKKMGDQVSVIKAEREAIEDELQACDKSAIENIELLHEQLKAKNAELNKLLTAKGKAEGDLRKQLEVLQEERSNMATELQTKNDELLKLSNEYSKSTSQLETIENDMKIIQRRNSKTFEELEELREKFDIEVQQKLKLKQQLEHSSPDEILARAKIENEENVKAKDGEIKELKKQLEDANEAKCDLELRLLDVMNDAVASQSTRDLMKADLQHKLDEENEKAESLQRLIDDKEKDINRLTMEFDILRVEMKKESYLRREEINDLNGEVVEKTTLLSSKEREFLKFRAEMEELKLQHASEIQKLRRQIDDFGANEFEMKKIKEVNLQLSSDLAKLKTEINRINMHDHSSESEDHSKRILRARNEQLMEQVERLNKKVRRMKRNVTLIEL
jgi:hypothetical protein